MRGPPKRKEVEMKRLKKLPADVTEDALLIALSGSYLWQFAHIWLEDTFCFRESCLPVRIVETVMFAAILVFGIRRLIQHVK